MALAAGRAPAGGGGLALTPPMGWMSWNLFGRDISDQLIREIADAMVANGLKAAGYEYVCIDDYWHGGRDSAGNLFPDAKKFPHGIKALADYVHAKGLKLGIYSDAGTMTCGRQPGGFGYEEKDARLFASWGVDYVKYDYCFAPEDEETAIRRYTAMGKALAATGRPMVYSICEWGPRKPWLWGARAGGHLWRTTWDVRDVWEAGKYQASVTGIMEILDHQAGLEEYAGPGHWNDPDMLVVGLYGKGKSTTREGYTPCNDAEYRSQMSLWCLLAAPLLATCDLRNMNAATKETLTNPEAIAVNQDRLGRQASRVIKDGATEVWRKPLAGDAYAIGILNRANEARTVKLRWADARIKGRYTVRDLWRRSNLGRSEDAFSTDLPPHATALLLLRV